LSITLWDGQTKNIKTIRYQAPQLRSALLELSEDGDTETKDSSDIKNH
jgi:hypothetical protein